MSAEIEIEEAPIALYRLYNPAGELIRVGVTENLPRRFRDYAQDVPWWPEVARKTVEWQADREAALWAETSIIHARRPVHNEMASRSTRSRGTAKYPLHHDPAAVTFARQRAGMTMTHLAKTVGLSLSLLSEIEKGTRNATPANLRKIADAIGCPLVVLENKRWPAESEASAPDPQPAGVTAA